MSVSRFLGRTMLAVTFGVAAACSDSTGPSVDSIDAAAALSTMQPVSAVFEQPTMSALEGAGSFFGGSFGIGPMLNITSSATRSGFDPRVLRNLVPGTVTAKTVIPVDARGYTYIYDETEAAYVVDTEATDSPATGVRIVLYAWDALAGAPASPLNRIGYVDLTDESTANNDVLRVRVIRDQGSLELTNYTIAHGVTANGETFGITGSATNGSATLNFDLDGSTSGDVGSQVSDFSFDISMTGGASVGFSVSYDEAAESGTIGLSLTNQGHTLTFDLNSTPTAGNGQVKYDGRLYATYTATYNPTTGQSTEQFVKANGQPLTQDELEQLSTLFAGALEIGGFFGVLLWPVYAFAA